MTEPVWMPIALKEIGVAEIPGPTDNKRIIEYHHATNLSKDDGSESELTAWCSSFANWVMKQAGIPGTGSAWARDWEDWGIELSKPRYGCLALYERNEPGGDSHIAFWTGESGENDKCVGGNQGNSVCEKLQAKDTLISYRWPKNVPFENITHVNSGDPVATQTLAWGARAAWTAQTESCVAVSELCDINPADGDEWHPLFMMMSEEERTAFWSQLVSIIAKYESDFNPDCIYQESFGVKSIGLLQTSYEDEESYGIDFGLSRDKKDLQDPEKGLAFGIKIMEKLVKKDRYISKKESGKWLGLAEYWLTMRPGEDGYDEIKAYMKRLKF